MLITVTKDHLDRAITNNTCILYEAIKDVDPSVISTQAYSYTRDGVSKIIHKGPRRNACINLLKLFDAKELDLVLICLPQTFDFFDNV